jgi:heat shock protein HtpX
MKDLLLREKLRQLVQTAILAAGMLALLLWTGWQIFGVGGLYIFGGVGVVFLFFSARRRNRIVLSNGAPLQYADAPELHQTVRSLALQAGLASVPRIYYLPVPVMNALTIGSKHDSVIVVTYGLLSRLTSREIAGVLAHEISHIRNNDMWLFSMAQYLREATDFIARFGWFLLLFSLPIFLLSGTTLSFAAVLAMLAAPLLSMILQLALLRTREFSADLGAAELTDDPEGLASALRKIENPRRGVFGFLFPVPRTRESALFRTHPASDERVRRLEALADRREHHDLPPKVSGYRY